MILNESLFENLEDTIEINYNFDIERNSGSSSGSFDSSFGNWLPSERWKTYNIDWVYEIDIWDVIDYLMDLIRKKDPKLWEAIPEEENEYVKYFEDNFDTLYNKYEEDIYNHFYDKAKDDAEENWGR